ncbi:hypothetical protein JXJ21_22200 [candidate division KSB1 bacterium]|nr:hypothetical protein [candidate division KSB1 bacterium]
MDTATALQSFDYVIIAGYFAIVLGTSYYFSRRMKLTKDFFTAGGNISWWLSGISFFMASFSALTFVMYAELSYKYGIISILLYQVTVPSLIIAGIWFAKKWRRTRILTPVEFLEKRYNLFMRQALAWTGIPLRIVDDALKIFSTAIFLYAGMKLSIINLPVAIGIIGLITILYSFMGGQWGVIIIDFVQFIILLTCVLLLLPLTIIKIGGISAFFEQAPENFFQPQNGPYGGINILAFLILFIVALNSTWSLVQKYNCVKDEKEAQKVAWFVAILNFVGPIIFFIPAILARVLLPELSNPKYSYAELAFTVFPTGLMGMMVAGMFSATLSTMGSEFNVLAGIITNDFYKRILKPKATENELIVVGRISTIIIGVMIMIIAFLVSILQGYNLFDIMIKAFGALLPATALPILGGLLWKKINARGALTGLIAGAISGISLVIINLILVQRFSDQFASNPDLEYWLKQGWDACSILFNVAVTLAAMYFGTKIFKSSAADLQKIQTFYKNLDKPVEAVTEDKMSTAKISNFKIIGIMTALFGALILMVGLSLLIFSKSTWVIVLNSGVGAFLIILGFVLSKISQK